MINNFFLGNRKYVLLVLLLLFIFLSFSIIADDSTPIVYNHFPIITLTFDEPVIVDEATLICAEDDGICSSVYGQGVFSSISDETIQYSLSNNNRTVQYEILTPLVNDEYVFWTEVKDYLNNINNTININFIVQGDVMDITLEEPENGWSQIEVFNVTLESSNLSRCWFHIGNNIDIDFDYPDSNSSTTHKIVDMNSYHTLLRQDSRDLYVTCNRSSDGTYHFAHFNVAWDDTPPVIEYNLSDNPLVDISVPYVDLFAKSKKGSDVRADNIGCQIKGINNTPDDFVNFNNTDFPTDFSNISTYNIQNEYRLNFTGIRDNESIRYEENLFHYNISCKNKAGFYSDSEIIDLTVHFSRDFDIEMLNPEEYTSNPSPDLEIQTSVNTDWCNVYNDDENSFEMTRTDNRLYTIPLSSSLSPVSGENEIIVKCRSDYLRINKSETFSYILDSTDPTNLTIDYTPEMCSLSEIEFTLDADDADSGIDYYNYTIKNASNFILEQDTDRDGEITFSSDDLEVNATYTIDAYVFDEAGNYAHYPIVTVTIRDPESIICDRTAPSVSIIDEQLQDESNVTISCSDSHSGCIGIEYYLLTNISEDCVFENANLLYDTTFIIYDTQKVCAQASDAAGNKRNASKIVEVEVYIPDHCQDEIQNEDETGVDCGGSCSGCELGEPCVHNTDCEDEWCNEFICDFPTCDDTIMNGDEAGADCGGSCPNGCGEGSDCEEDSDCTTNWCYENVCTNSSCTDNILNGFESSTDCGGPDCEQCGLGEDCIDDSDCDSDYCNLGICGMPSAGDEDSDNDGMPDWWEDQYGLDKDDPDDAYEDLDSDGFTNLEEYLAGTDPTDPNDHPGGGKKANILSLILLILGIIFTLGGIGYLVYDHYYIQPAIKRKNEERQRKTLSSSNVKNGLTKEQILALQRKKQMMQDKFSKTSDINKDKFSSQFADFEEETKEIKDQKNQKESKKNKEIMQNMQKKRNSDNTKVTKSEKKKLDAGLKGDFVDLDDLKKNADNSSSKTISIKNKRVGKDIFEALNKIKSKKKSKSKIESKIEPKLKSKFIETNDLDKLLSLTDKQLLDKKNIKDKKESLVTDKKDNSEIENKDFKKEEKITDKEQVFSALDEIVSKRTKNKSKLKKEGEKERNNIIQSKELVELFRTKKLDINVFKVILSELMDSGKLNKKDISSIIFKLLEQKMIEKDVAHKVLKDMKLINE